MITVAMAIVCSFLFPLQADGANQQRDIPPCTHSPNDVTHYPDHMVRPQYPKDALRNGIGGEVELRVVIAPDGKSQAIAVLNGDSALSQNAIVAIRKWRFHPERRQGQAVETTYKIHVRFNPSLQEANSDVELESPLPEPPTISSLATLRRQNLGLEIHHVSEPGIVAPKPLYSPEPEFSEKARIEKHQGEVDIDLVVGTDGLPNDPQITCSSAPDLNDNAIAAVRQWKFAPATKVGKAVAIEIVVEVSFRLDGNTEH